MQYFRNTKPLSQLLYFWGIFFIFAIIFSTISLYAVSAVNNIPISEISTFLNKNISLQAWLQLCSQLFMFGFPAALFIFIFWRNFKQTLWNQKIKSKYLLLLLGISLLIVSFPLFNILQTWNEGFHFPSFLSQYEDYWRKIGIANQTSIHQFLLDTSTIAFYRNILVMAIAPAILEELFFRGVLQQIIISLTNRKHLSIFLTAIVFTLFHFEPFVFLPRFLLALFLGYLFFYSKNLWVSASFHFLNNIVIVIFYFLYAKNLTNFNPNSTIDMHWGISVLSFFITTILVFILFFFVLNPKKELTQKYFCKKERTT